MKRFKNLIRLIFIIPFSFSSLNSCGITNPLSRPKDWEEELWFLDRVDDFDFSSYKCCYDSLYCMGCSPKYYLKKYGDFSYDEYGTIIFPKEVIIYHVGPYPDLSSKENYVIDVDIINCDVTFYGLTLNSTIEEFEDVFLGFGFKTAGKSENSIRFEKDTFIVSFNSLTKRVSFKALQSNIHGIVY